MPLDYDKLLRWPIPARTQSYTKRDSMLYALGLGVAQDDATDAAALRFVYEKELAALPTMAVVLGSSSDWIRDPATGIDYLRLLHGEQSLTLHRPLPVEATLVSHSKVEEVYDKGADKGAVMYMSRRLVDEKSGEAIATVGSSAFLRGNGGFGGKPGGAHGSHAPHPAPDESRAPDARVSITTRRDQALLYRLSGDYNPLHADPAVAKAAGFERPILHGLCSYGIAGRAVLGALCGNEPARLKRLDVRFSNTVLPGETLVTEIWREGRGRAAFRVKIAERDKVALNNGYAEFDE
jgi:acyl dehydratase